VHSEELSAELTGMQWWLLKMAWPMVAWHRQRELGERQRV